MRVEDGRRRSGSFGARVVDVGPIVRLGGGVPAADGALAQLHQGDPGVFEIFEESRELLRCFEVVDRLLL